METPGDPLSAPLSAENWTAAVPDGERIYAVGDLHGRLDLLEEMLGLIKADAAGASLDKLWLVYLGDYVDRGPDVRAVVDRLIAGPPDGFEQICLLGNHEAWMLEFLENARAGNGWLMNGGGATLASYGVGSRKLALTSRLEAMRRDFDAALPDDHRTFYAGLDRMWRRGGYAFVHAGVMPGTPLDEQDDRDLLWIREDFLEATDDFGAVVVHGHTIVDVPAVRANRIGIDTGAFATGRLTCLALEGTDRRFLQT